ncbi:DUF2589 domain-containing protein [Sphaerisporangium aureirubrum]|uniref:DUF2589 domain-containing protein n=1 Tax=Sphaerisporangium aureirubrum TaxID=1544736 RepID=A0ABW1NVY6_9ACTN
MTDSNAPGGDDESEPAAGPAGEMAGTGGAVDPAEAAAAARDLATAAAAAVATAADASKPLAAASADLSGDLNNIDFRKMIGGPLQAAVDAQVASAMAAVDFITKVGFTAAANGADGKPDLSKRELVMVDFSHTRNDIGPDGKSVPKTTHVRVPLLAMLPIPSLRIEHVVIDFNVKLNSVESAATSDTLGVGVEAGGGFGPVNFKVSASYQRKTSSNVEVKKEYALNVNVKAVQDEMPAGLEKVIGMLSA